MIALISSFVFTGCVSRSERTPGGFQDRSEQDPALSGSGEKLAVIVEQQGRPTVQLRDLRNGQILPLRHFARHQPHSSPSLSWNGRYLAVIIQKGRRREAVIEDRLSGRFLPLRLPGGREPIRLSLSPDARQVAVQVTDRGHWHVELLDLRDLLEPDQAAGLRRSTPPSSSWRQP